MTTALPDRHIPREVQPAAERPFNDHLRNSEACNPHDYVRWDDRREFSAMGRGDRQPDRSEFSDVAPTTMITNSDAEDSRPSYHREISEPFTLDDVRAARVGRWSAEENRNPRRYPKVVVRPTWRVFERTAGYRARACEELPAHLYEPEIQAHLFQERRERAAARQAERAAAAR